MIATAIERERRVFLWLLGVFVVTIILLMIVPASSLENGSASTWSIGRAERVAVVVARHMECPSGTTGYAWAEANDRQPHGFEVVGRCA